MDTACVANIEVICRVLEDGRRLEEDRKAWQQHAAKSLDKRAGSLSRARSKSIGARSAPHVKNPSAFDSLTEATLLGGEPLATAGRPAETDEEEGVDGAP